MTGDEELIRIPHTKIFFNTNHSALGIDTSSRFLCRYDKDLDYFRVLKINILKFIGDIGVDQMIRLDDCRKIFCLFQRHLFSDY